MTDFINRARALDAAATEGPWRHWPEAGDIEIITDGYREVICTQVRPKKGWPYAWEKSPAYKHGEEHDAEFITHARTALPQAVAALRSVLDLHRPVSRFTVWGYEEFSFASIEDAEEYVGGSVEADEFKLCVECKRVEDGAADNAAEIGYETSLYPCETRRALAAALGEDEK